MSMETLETMEIMDAAPPGASDRCLELIGVRKVFKSDLLKKKQVAVDDLSCRFPAGRCTGLLGHNGAGKTTTIRMILGLTTPDTGKILFEGAPLATATKRFIGYMPEVNKLPAALTPDELLTQQLRLFHPEHIKGAAALRQAVEERLAAVGLTAHRKKRVGHMSKGMARRLAWAQATIHRPRFLILDEPSSGLDPLGRQQMLAWIAEEKTRGTGILLCTHELAQIQALCDELHILRQGRLVHSAGRRHQAPAGGTLQDRYSLHVSGADEAALTRLGVKAGLKPWTSIRREGFLAMLAFDEYADAAAWLTHCAAQGFVVTRFGEEAWLGDAELLQHFASDV
jgi:ABC-2 type transport system ATP-binding protein